MTLDKPHSKFEHVYAIVRFDFPINSESPTNSVTVVKVFSSEAAANQEASRLNHVNKYKSCTYDVYLSRFIA